MTRAALLAAAGLILSLTAPGQQPANAGTGPGTVFVPSNYIVGANDVLAIRVIEDPTLDGSGVVDHDGNFLLPTTRTPVNVAGKTLGEIDHAIEAALVKDSLLLPPAHVVTSVVLVESKPVMVTGYVRQTVTMQAVQPISVLEALGRAGGPLDPSSSIEVWRNENGQDVLKYKGTNTSLVRAASDRVPLLAGGETVKVFPGGKVYLGGQFNHPTQVALDDSDPLTVTKALILGGQLTKTADPSKAVIIHDVGNTDHEMRTPVDVKAILAGKAADVRLTANDMLYVPQSGAKATEFTALNSGLQIFSVVAAGLLLTH